MSNPASLAPLAPTLPLAGAVISSVLYRVSGRAALVVSVVALAGCAGVLALLAPRVYGGRVLVEHLGGWHPEHGTQLGVTLGIDPFGLTFALLASGIGTVLLVFTAASLRGLGDKELGTYAALFQLLLAALVASALAADLLDLFVWFEVAGLASYGLTCFHLERPIALEAGFKIMVLTNLGAFCLFLAVVLLYGGHGALNLGQLHGSLAEGVHDADLVALALVVCAFGTKAGLMPFHGWLPDAHEAAPGPVSALFSGLMVNLGVVGLARVVCQTFPESSTVVLHLLAVLGCVSALLGAVLALVQDDLKRVLAFDTVSQMGLLVVALSVHSEEATAGLVYHLVDHALFKSLLFLCAGAIVHATGMTRLSQMGGLARHRPVACAAFCVGVLAIAGVPPLNGYVSVGLIHHSLEVEHLHVEFAVLSLAQAVTVAALGRAAYLAFFRRREDDYDTLERPNPAMVGSFGALAAGCVVFGAFPHWVLDHVATPAATGLMSPETYDAAVLGHARALPARAVSFDYVLPSTMIEAALTLLAGAALAWWYVARDREPRPLTWLRRLHTGSVNDYAAYSLSGLAITVLVLLAWP